MRYLVPTFSISVFALNILAFLCPDRSIFPLVLLLADLRLNCTVSILWHPSISAATNLSYPVLVLTSTMFHYYYLENSSECKFVLNGLCCKTSHKLCSFHASNFVVPGSNTHETRRAVVSAAVHARSCAELVSIFASE